MREILIESGVPAGKEINTGYSGWNMTAPAEDGTYSLYETADERNCHVKFFWQKE